MQDSVKVIFNDKIQQIPAKGLKPKTKKKQEGTPKQKSKEEWEQDKQLHAFMKKSYFEFGCKSFDNRDGKLPNSSTRDMLNASVNALQSK